MMITNPVNYRCAGKVKNGQLLIPCVYCLRLAQPSPDRTPQQSPPAFINGQCPLRKQK